MCVHKYSQMLTAITKLFQAKLAKARYLQTEFRTAVNQEVLQLKRSNNQHEFKSNIDAIDATYGESIRLLDNEYGPLFAAEEEEYSTKFRKLEAN